MHNTQRIYWPSLHYGSAWLKLRGVHDLLYLGCASLFTLWTRFCIISFYLLMWGGVNWTTVHYLPSFFFQCCCSLFSHCSYVADAKFQFITTTFHLSCLFHPSLNHVSTFSVSLSLPYSSWCFTLHSDFYILLSLSSSPRLFTYVSRLTCCSIVGLTFRT